jgi:glycerol uptake facilitator protein
MSIFTAELIGTAILVLLGDGVVAAVLLNRSKAQNAGWIVICFGWGFAVAIAVYAVVQYSGAHINPAVTLGLWSLDNGSVDGGDVYKYLLGQFAGAAIGAILVFLTYFLHWRETDDPGLKLGVFSTGPAIRNPAFNFVTEFIGTFMLVFGVLAIGNQFSEDGLGGGTDLSTALGGSFTPLLVGFLVVAIGLSLGGPTGYAINPARDLGPRIMHQLLPIPGKGSSDWAYAWIPVIAPIAGGIVGAQVFDALYPG